MKKRLDELADEIERVASDLRALDEDKSRSATRASRPDGEFEEVLLAEMERVVRGLREDDARLGAVMDRALAEKVDRERVARKLTPEGRHKLAELYDDTAETLGSVVLRLIQLGNVARTGSPDGGKAVTGADPSEKKSVNALRDLVATLRADAVTLRRL